jgi:hypothetical protein
LTATVPLIVLPTLWAHFCLPVFASSATILPLLVPATTVPRATTGVPVKSPSLEKWLQAMPRLFIWSAGGPFSAPSRVLDRSRP